MRKIIRSAFIISALALFCAPLRLPAQDKLLTPRINAYTDSALHLMRMNRSDLFMRWDSPPDDLFRLSLIKRLFGDPLSTMTIADSLAHALPSSFDEPLEFIQTFAGPMDVALPKFDLLAPRLTQKELLAKYNVETEHFPRQLRAAVTELMSGIAAADTLMRRARAVYTREEFQFLVANADSMFRESADNENKTLVQVKTDQIEGITVAERVYKLAQRYPRALMYEAAGILLQSVKIAKSYLAEMPESSKDTVRSVTFNSPLGRVAIGGVGRDEYDGNYLCIIDLGGDDIYKYPESNNVAALATPARVILDCGGNDVYEGNEFSYASGYFGVSIVDDMGGDDLYSVANFGLGAGLFGAGILLDEGGDDIYKGGTFVEGCGAFGFGVLIDKSGNDTYQAEFNSQAFGSTWGFGAIVDEKGNDNYITSPKFIDVLRYADHYETFTQGCGLGNNPTESGGIGILSDRAGNDNYTTDIFGQGCGYWYSLGALVDDGGNDHYNAWQYAQGAGVHRAFGALIDKKGDDNYTSHGVSQGCGHDAGFGGLLDCAGDDFYSTESLSLGGGNAYAISWFCDAGGNDGYLAKNLDNTFGFSDKREDYGMIGIFLDLGGHDVFPTYTGRTNSYWTQSTFGVGIDAPGTDTTEQHKENKKYDDSVRAARDLAPDIPTLFMQASAAEDKFQYLVQPACAELVKRQAESIPFLLSYLSTYQAREALALRYYILPKMGDEIKPILRDSLASGNWRTVSMCLMVLGAIGDSSYAADVMPFLHNPKWIHRANAARQLGVLKNTDADSALLYALQNDTVEMVRMRAVYSLGELGDVDAADAIINALSDKNQIVRNKASDALIRLGDKVQKNVLNALETATGYEQEYLVELLAGFPKAKGVKKLLTGFLRDEDPANRRAAMTAMEKIAKDKVLGKAYLRDLDKDAKTESDKVIQERMTRVITALSEKKK